MVWQQAIIWFNDCMVYQQIYRYASLALDGLTHEQLEKNGCIISTVTIDVALSVPTVWIKYQLHWITFRQK